eukprot:SAG11_NODE_3446_length_2443_cov_1.235922_2_plen_123_part_00
MRVDDRGGDEGEIVSVVTYAGALRREHEVRRRARSFEGHREGQHLAAVDAGRLKCARRICGHAVVESVLKNSQQMYPGFERIRVSKPTGRADDRATKYWQQGGRGATLRRVQYSHGTTNTAV